MMKQRLTAIILFFFSILASLPGYAQNVVTLGELKATGMVQIESSSGKWQPSMPTYPLLGRTGIKTDDGIAALMFRDGSRADLAQESIAVVTGSPSAYTVNLAKGSIVFNIQPPATLTIVTPSGTVFVNRADNPVQKVGFEKEARVLGAVIVSDKGLEVKSLSGRIRISYAGGTKVVASGESLFVGGDGSAQAYQTQAVGQGSSANKKDDDDRKPGAYWETGTGSRYAPYVITGLFILSGTLISWDTWTHHGHRGIASPSVP